MIPSIVYGVLYSLLPLILMVVGTRFPSDTFIYASIASILILILLRTCNVLRKETDPFLIFCIGLSLILQNTLPSDYLIGIDNHAEYYFSYLALNKGWDINLPYDYNSSILLGLIIPFISKYLLTPLELIFKIYLPLLLASIPVVCYFIFKKAFNETTSFLSCIFLISMPAFFLEIPSIGKQIVGELFLVLTLYTLFISKLQNVKKGVIASILGGLTVMTHYSMGFILIPYILGATLILLGIKYIIKQDIQISLKPPLYSLLVLILLLVTYYSSVTQGIFIKRIEALTLIQTSRIYSILGLDNSGLLARFSVVVKESAPDTQIIYPWVEDTENTTVTSIPGDPLIVPINKNLLDYLNNQGDIIRGALGLDFLEKSLPGQIFRIFQYLTEVFLLIGFLYFFLKRKYKNHWGFTSLFLTGWTLLTITVLLPSFSFILNASRLYHLALILIAPAFILGFFKRPKLSLLILLPYLVFTSGVVLEILKTDTLKSLDIPYSNGLSGARLDLAGIYSDNDNLVRNYIIENKSLPVFTDLWGYAFLVEKLRQETWYIPSNCTKIPPNTYIFLRERNIETNTLCYWGGIGLRVSKTFQEARLDKELEKRRLVKECGSARLYGPKLIDN